MSQDEIVRAIRNLGNKAFLHELMNEYFRLHYPNPDLRREQLEKTKYYTVKNAVHVYIMKAKRNGLISARKVRVPHPTNTLSPGLNKTEYYVLEPDQLK